MRAAWIALLLVTLVPALASAVTKDEIISLSKAGVSESVILALIDRDKSVFTIEPNELVTLKQAGVSEAIVVAMLRSGRQQVLDAAPASPRMVAPEIIVVGHGPDTPNVTHRDMYGTAFSANAIWPPYPLVIVAPRDCVTTVTKNPRTAAPAPAFGRFMSDPTARFMNTGVLPIEGALGADSAVIDCQPSIEAPRGRARGRR